MIKYTKFRKPILYAVGFVVLLFIVFSLFALTYRITHAKKMLRNVTYSGISVSSVPVLEAMDLITKRNEDILKNKVILSAGDKSYETQFFSMGYMINNEKSFNKTYDTGRKNNLSGLIQFYKVVLFGYDVQPDFEINNIVRDSFVASLRIELEKDPIDASFVIDKDSISIKQEETGRRMVLDDLFKSADSTILNNTANINVLLTDEQPKILASDLTSGLEKAIAYSSKNISLKYESKIIKVTKSDLLSWLSFDRDKQFEPYFELDKIKNYLRTIAYLNNISVTDQKTDYVSGMTIQKGRNGKELDIVKSADMIKAELEKDQTEISLPISTINFKTYGRFNEAYIDLDLFTHKLNMLDSNNNIIMSTNFRDGSYDNNVPSGTYKINSKAPSKISSLYNMEMLFWQNFYNGWGFHEASYPGTGGCIGLSYSDAEKLYSLTSIGTIVYVHDSDPNASCTKEYFDAIERWQSSSDLTKVYNGSSQCVKDRLRGNLPDVYWPY